MEMVKVLKRWGGREEFDGSKLAHSISRAARDVSVGVDGSVEEVVRRISVGEGEYTASIMDKLHFELLRMAIEEPDMAQVARAHLLGAIYKDAVGKGWLRAGRDEGEYRAAFVRNLLALADAGIVSRERLAPYVDHLGELSRALAPGRDWELGYSALRLFYSGNYALRFPDGRLAETPQYAAMRVAMGVALAEALYGGDPVDWAKRFYAYISARIVVPASPYWFNALTPRQAFGSCFTLEVDDCLSSLTHPGRNCIYDALAQSGLIQQAGGGVGYDFSLLRPEGDIVKSSVGVASGPVSFMRLFDVNVDVIKQGGKRRGAQMGTLHDFHPDIPKFITAKTGAAKDVALQNFNISVMASDYFMEAVLRGGKWRLVNPRRLRELGIKVTEYWGDEYRKVLESVPRDAVWAEMDARELFERIVRGAWDSGDPGMVYKDNMNAAKPIDDVLDGERYVWWTVNPCSETVQRPFEICNLASINVAALVRDGDVDWDALEDAVRIATRLLDNAIDVQDYPHPLIERWAKLSRKNGLGIMGLAETLVKLGIPYASRAALGLAAEITARMYMAALEESSRLARERGPFPLFDRSSYRRGELPVLRAQDHYVARYGPLRESLPQRAREVADEVFKITGEVRGKHAERLDRLGEIVRGGVRNSVVLSVAPTGRISIYAGTTSGVEPIFALAYIRNVTVGTLVEYYEPFVEWARAKGMWTEDVRRSIEEDGTLRSADLPDEVKRLFATAHEIGWQWHVAMLSVVTHWVDQSVSKTINLPRDASVDDVRDAFLAAWVSGVKGITVFRDRSKEVQVIYTGLREQPKRRLAFKVAPMPRALEDARLSVVEEGRDPYCKTGECS